MNSHAEILDTGCSVSGSLSIQAKLRALQRRIPIVVLIAVAAFLLKTCMAYLTYGTDDVTI